jgi:phosphatidate cytidylyltransferase
VDEEEQEPKEPRRPPAEGVRIIGAEEAQAALDAGQVAGRRPDDEPRYGDVPPSPAGPRPAHRFPLPDSVDPASAVPRPPVVPPAAPPAPGPAEPRTPRRGISLPQAGGPEMPHWTEPPTGEVPDLGGERSPAGGEDDLAAWSSLGTRGLRWRDQAGDWEDGGDVGALGDKESRVGALDTSRSERSDLYSFDESFERLEEERSGSHPVTSALPAQPADATLRTRTRAPSGRARGGGRSRTRRGGESGSPVPPAGGRDLPTAIVVGLGLFVLALVFFKLGPKPALVLATAIVTVTALELYNLLQRVGFRPATLLGLCATVAIMLAGYWRGEAAIPIVLVLVFATSMLWYMLGVVEARPLVNVGVTVMSFVWVGVFGSYAALMLRQRHGVGLLLGAVLITVASDTLGYLAGSQFGSRSLAPEVSPGKTWEGLLLGGVGALLVAGVLVAHIHPWHLRNALALGVLLAVVAPLGDLCESMIKRDLHLKDSGSILPGHGGFLDRVDALLFALPATYYLAQYLKIH